MEGEDEVEEETDGEGVEVEVEAGAFLEEHPEGLVVQDFLVVEALEEGEGVEGMVVEGMVAAPWEGEDLEGLVVGTDSNHIECNFVLFRIY